MEIDYFIAGLEIEADRVASAKNNIIHDDNSNLFTGIGCFKGRHLLNIKYDA